jgi:hypothetical protein
MEVRDSYTKEDFSSFFLVRGAPQAMIDDVWAAVVEALGIKDFKPHPTDRLGKDYGLVDEDLDEDIVLALLQRHGCRIPPPHELERMGPIETVADLMDFLVKMHPLPSPGQAR